MDKIEVVRELFRIAKSLTNDVTGRTRKADFGDVPMYMNVTDFYDWDSRLLPRNTSMSESEQMRVAMDLVRDAQVWISSDVMRLMRSALNHSSSRRQAEKSGLVLKG